MPPCLCFCFPRPYLGCPSPPCSLKVLFGLQGPAPMFPSGSNPPDRPPPPPAGGFLPLWAASPLLTLLLEDCFSEVRLLRQTVAPRRKDAVSAAVGLSTEPATSCTEFSPASHLQLRPSLGKVMAKRWAVGLLDAAGALRRAPVWVKR